MKQAALLRQFSQLIYRFDATSASEKVQLLQQLAGQPLPADKQLIAYHEALLFTAAYPETKRVDQAVQRELHRIATAVKKMPLVKKQTLADSGLPFTQMITRFTPEMLSLLEADPHCELKLDSFDAAGRSLGSVLRITLPAIEKEIAAAETDNDSLLDWLGIQKKDRLKFILEEFAAMRESPFVKELLWQELMAFVQLDLRHPDFSRAFNRIADAPVFYHSAIEKRIDVQALLNEPLPAPKQLSKAQRSAIVGVIRRAMVLTLRETDTSTYMHENTLRYYELGRGISVALYGMDAAHQLPLQSYIGYTLFKNGYPAAYGGSWVFGTAALFGLNILDSFRGGESAFIMGQLLRVYTQAFALHSIEVEAYQIGKDNEDGINSGAYWFYYRFGFRSIDLKLQKLAAAEQHKITRNKTYRSSRETLLRLAESNIALTLTPQGITRFDDYSWRITQVIVKKYKGMRAAALKAAVESLKTLLNVDAKFIQRYSNSFEEWALFVAAYPIQPSLLPLLREIITTKTDDPYTYNAKVQVLLSKR